MTRGWTTAGCGLVAGMLLLAGGTFADLSAQSGSRHIRMVEKLDRGEVVFGASVAHRTPEGAVEMIRDPTSDFLFYDMEHSSFDVPQLRTFLQFLLSPAAILARGRPGTEHPVLVRIPANGREMNQWIIKNVLDQGAHGVLAPFIENAAQAENVVRAMRYPAPPDASHPHPPGERGSGAGWAVRLWGVSGAEYRRLAEPWGLSPHGELLNLLLIENEEGVRNSREIAQVPGVSVLVPAPGDLNSFYNGDSEKVEAAIQEVLAACLEFDVPCGITVGPGDVVERIRQGFRVLIGGDEARRIGHAYLASPGETSSVSRPMIPVEQSWDAPRRWQGVVPCADCEGIQTTLELRPDGVAFREDAFRGVGAPATTGGSGAVDGNGAGDRPAVADTVFGSFGRWEWEGADRIRVYDSGGNPGGFRVTPGGGLRMLSLTGEEIQSELNYTLAPLPTPHPFEAAVRLNGAFVYFADSALLMECESGLQFPVAMAEGYLPLERAYLEVGLPPQAPLQVRLRGRLEERPAMEGDGTEWSFVVESMGELPDATRPCGVLELRDQVASGVWTLEAFLPAASGGPETPTEGPAFPTLQWDREAGQWAGSGGCNRFMGPGALRGSALHVGALAVTRRACPDVMAQEDRFLGLLQDGGTLRVAEDGALILSQGPHAVARFRR